MISPDENLFTGGWDPINNHQDMEHVLSVPRIGISSSLLADSLKISRSTWTECPGGDCLRWEVQRWFGMVEFRLRRLRQMLCNCPAISQAWIWRTAFSTFMKLGGSRRQDWCIGFCFQGEEVGTVSKRGSLFLRTWVPKIALGVLKSKF